jgi:hypothetical protein
MSKILGRRLIVLGFPNRAHSHLSLRKISRDVQYHKDVPLNPRNII